MDELQSLSMKLLTFTEDQKHISDSTKINLRETLLDLIGEHLHARKDNNIVSLLDFIGN